MSRPSLIMVEDEAALRDSLCLYLEACGFEARGVGDATALERAWSERPADLVVLDVNLPGENGFAIAARLRRQSAVGIIMMTARSTADDRITGFETGADIYLVKPVLPQELQAAAHRLLTRVETSRAVEPPAPASGWSFDPATWSLIAPNGAAIVLTTGEFRLVQRLTATPGLPVAVPELLQAIYGGTHDLSDRNKLDVLLSRLRGKTELKTGYAPPIRAVRGVGYVFLESPGQSTSTFEPQKSARNKRQR